MIKPTINWADFEKLDIRTGTIETAVIFEKAHRPAYQITINFGDIGILKTSAQLTVSYKPEELVGRQVMAVVNFPPKQIANFMSQCLILGAIDGKDVILIHPDRNVENGLAIG